MELKHDIESWNTIMTFNHEICEWIMKLNHKFKSWIQINGTNHEAFHSIMKPNHKLEKMIKQRIMNEIVKANSWINYALHHEIEMRSQIMIMKPWTDAWYQYVESCHLNCQKNH